MRALAARYVFAIKITKLLAFKEFVLSNKPKLDEKNKVYKSTTVALASKFPIKNIENISKSSDFTFAREPIKATISFKNDLDINVYVAHLKSNRLNEFEYKFTKDSTLEEKKEKLNIALKNNYPYRDWETDRKSTRLNSSHITRSRMPSSA